MILNLKNVKNNIVNKHAKLIVYFYVLYLFFISFFMLNFFNVLNKNYNHSIVYNNKTKEYQFFNKKNFPDIEICEQNNKTYLCDEKTGKIIDNYEYLLIRYVYDKTGEKFYLNDKVLGLTNKQRTIYLFFLLFVFLLPQLMLFFKISEITVKNFKKFQKDVLSIAILPNLMFQTFFICMISLVGPEVIKNNNSQQDINLDSIISVKKNDLTDSYICLNYTNDKNPVVIIDKNKIKK